MGNVRTSTHHKIHNAAEELGVPFMASRRTFFFCGKSEPMTDGNRSGVHLALLLPKLVEDILDVPFLREKELSGVEVPRNVHT
jgi:hypothetical protein